MMFVYQRVDIGYVFLSSLPGPSTGAGAVEDPFEFETIAAYSWPM
jgi:hypothetical protein